MPLMTVEIDETTWDALTAGVELKTKQNFSDVGDDAIMKVESQGSEVARSDLPVETAIEEIECVKNHCRTQTNQG